MKTVRMKKFSENDEAAADVDNDDIKDGNKKGYQKLPTFYFEKGTCMYDQILRKISRKISIVTQHLHHFQTSKLFFAKLV